MKGLLKRYLDKLYEAQDMLTDVIEDELNELKNAVCARCLNNNCQHNEEDRKWYCPLSVVELEVEKKINDEKFHRINFA